MLWSRLKGRWAAAVVAGAALATVGILAYNAACSNSNSPAIDLVIKPQNRSSQAPNRPDESSSARKRAASNYPYHNNARAIKRIRSVSLSLEAKPVSSDIVVTDNASSTDSSHPSTSSSDLTADDQVGSEVSEQTPDSDCDSDVDGLEHFGPVMESLDLEALKMEAVRVRKEFIRRTFYRCPEDLSCVLLGEPRHGSFNLAYSIQFSDGIRWIARIPGHGHSFDSLHQAKMDSEYHTMRYIRERTSIPVPQIYYWTTNTDKVGSAFAFMEFIDGFSLHMLWETTLQEHEKLRILDDTARYMSELEALRYEKSGMLRFEPGETVPVVKPQIYFKAASTGEEDGIPWGDGYEDEMHATYAEQLTADNRNTYEGTGKAGDAAMSVLELAIASIPDYLDRACPKALYMPDIALHNIMVDRSGTVIGFLDWDMVGVLPTSAGCAKIPPWISLDLLAPMQWDHDNCGEADDDDTMSENLKCAKKRMVGYRKYYADSYATYVERFTTDYDTRITKTSHILEAIETAICSRLSRTYILDLLIEHAFYGKAPFMMIEYVRAYENGDTQRHDEILREGFKNLWHAEWEQPSESEGDNPKDIMESSSDSEAYEFEESTIASSRSDIDVSLDDEKPPSEPGAGDIEEIQEDFLQTEAFINTDEREVTQEEPEVDIPLGKTEESVQIEADVPGEEAVESSKSNSVTPENGKKKIRKKRKDNKNRKDKKRKNKKRKNAKSV